MVEDPQTWRTATSARPRPPTARPYRLVTTPVQFSGSVAPAKRGPEVQRALRRDPGGSRLRPGQIIELKSRGSGCLASAWLGLKFRVFSGSAASNAGLKISRARRRHRFAVQGYPPQDAARPRSKGVCSWRECSKGSRCSRSLGVGLRPSAGAVLADWGADVVKVEPPTGDPIRGLVNAGIGGGSGPSFPGGLEPGKNVAST